MARSTSNDRRLARYEKFEKRHTKDRTKRIPYAKTKMKHLYRVRAHDSNDRLIFFKTRTKSPTTTIQRFATLQGFKIDRITH